MDIFCRAGSPPVSKLLIGAMCAVFWTSSLNYIQKFRYLFTTQRREGQHHQPKEGVFLLVVLKFQHIYCSPLLPPSLFEGCCFLPSLLVGGALLPLPLRVVVIFSWRFPFSSFGVLFGVALLSPPLLRVVVLLPFQRTPNLVTQLM